MRKPRYTGILVLLLMFVVAGSTADAVTKEDAVACVLDQQAENKAVYYASLEEALRNAEGADEVQLYQNVTVEPEVLEAAPCSIDGNAEVVISVEGGVLQLKRNVEFQGITLKSSDSSQRMEVNAGNHRLTLRGVTLEGSVHYEEQGELELLYYGQYDTRMDSVLGKGTLNTIGTDFYADYIEASYLDPCGYHKLICTADQKQDTFVKIFNSADRPMVRTLFTGLEWYFDVEDETAFRALIARDSSDEAITLLQFDQPVKLKENELANLRVDKLKPYFAEKNGQVFRLFGRNGIGTPYTETFREYTAQYVEAYDFRVNRSADERRLYRLKDAVSFEGMEAVITLRSGNEYNHIIAKGLADVNKGKCFDEGQIRSNLNNSGVIHEPYIQQVELVWDAGDGVELQQVLYKVTDYDQLSLGRTGALSSKHVNVTLDTAAMDRAGFRYETDGNMVRVEKGGKIYLTIKPRDFYAVDSVTPGTAGNCQIESLGGHRYAVWDCSAKYADLEIAARYAGVNYVYDGDKGSVVSDEENNILRFVPAEGCVVKDVVADGKSLGAVNELEIYGQYQSLKIIFAKQEEAVESGTSSAASKEKLIAGVKATTIKASTVNVVGTKIRVNWKKSPGYKVDYYQIFRSTKRNSGYGTKPIYTTKTGKATKYTNSKNLKVGTRYYYKVRGVRVIDGKKYYTKWSNKANRTAIYTPQASGKY